jgi:hypothetical protein
MEKLCQLIFELIMKNTLSGILPIPILHAVSLASRPDFHPEINASARCLLLCFLQRADKRSPTAVFRARIDRLADDFGVSTRTVHNWLVSLRDQGLLIWRQRRNCFGSFGIAVRLSDACRQALFPPLNLSREKNISDADIPLTTKDQPSEDFSKTVSTPGNADNGKPNQEPVTHEHQSSKTIVLPAELSTLHTDIGLTEATVCWLMKVSTSRGKRLGDVYAYCRSYVTGLDAARAKAYLLKCILGQQDFAVELSNKQERVKQAQAHPMLQAALPVVRRFAYLLASQPQAGRHQTLVASGKEFRLLDRVAYLCRIGIDGIGGVIRPLNETMDRDRLLQLYPQLNTSQRSYASSCARTI